MTHPHKFIAIKKFSYLIISLFAFCHLSGQKTPPVPLPPQEEEIFKVVEEMPRFPGCDSSNVSARKKEDCAKGKMLDYIYDNQVYPKEAKKHNVEGMAVVQFTVWKDSTIRNIKIVRDPGSGIGEEAARIVESMGNMKEKWSPGIQRGRQVCVQYTLPIKFKLEDNGASSKKKKSSSKDDIIHITSVHEDPMFPGCKKYKNHNCTTEKLQAFIKENQLYPQEALDNKTEGIVKLYFVIETDGTISNIEAINKLPHGLSDDAVEIIEWMNSEEIRWKPGMVNYKPVRTRYYVDIAYDIADWKSRN